MKHTLLILAIAVGTLGCSKESTPDPTTATLATPAPGTGSYKLDGRLVTCTAKATLFSPAGSNVDYLFVRLTTTPQPAAGEEALSVEYSKLPGQPASAYRSSSIVLFRNQEQPIFFNLSPTPTPATTSGGGDTGTFATTSIMQSPTLSITEGVFTDIRP